MSVRNENWGILVSSVVLVLGYWIADWNPSEDAAFLIIAATFVSGLAVIAGLYEREDRRHRKER